MEMKESGQDKQENTDKVGQDLQDLPVDPVRIIVRILSKVFFGAAVGESLIIKLQ